jgi:hypothetical protein
VWPLPAAKRDGHAAVGQALVELLLEQQHRSLMVPRRAGREPVTASLSGR